MTATRYALRLWRDPVIVVATLVTVLSMVLLLLRVGGPTGQVWLYWLLQPIGDLVRVVCGIRVARRPEATPAVRRLWGGVAMISVLLCLGDSYHVVLTLVRPGVESAPGSVPQAVMWAGAVAILLVIVLTHRVQATGRARARMMLDVATIMTAAATLAWYFSVQELAEVSESSGPLVISGLMLLLVYGAIRMIFGGSPPFSRYAGLSAVVGAAWLGLAVAAVPFTEDGLGVQTAVRMPALLLLVVCVRLQELEMRSVHAELRRRGPRKYSISPYLGLGVTYTMLMIVLLQTGPQGGAHMWGVVIGAIMSSVLVVVRQLLAFDDNAKLAAGLDDGVLELGLQEQRFRSLVQHASDVTLVIGEDAVIDYASPALRRILGRDPASVIGRNITDYIHPDDLAEILGWFTAPDFGPGQTIRYMVRGLHEDGSWHWLQTTCTNLRAEPSVRGLVFNSRDVTEAKRLQERLEYQAGHDMLTGLANRLAFDARLTEVSGSTGTADGHAPETVAVVQIDLDGFKAVNDTMGHHAGDLLLAAVGERLADCVRAGDLAARLGGDEFALLLTDADMSDVEALVDRIRSVFTESVLIDGTAVPIRASIGTALGRATEAERLLRTADGAMYQDKRRARAGRAASVFAE